MAFPQPTMSYLSDIYFGRGTISGIGEILSKCRIRRPLIVTDSGLVELGFVERLRIDPAAVFDGVITNPTEESAFAGLSALRSAECDGIVAVGGGSPIDLAKIIALLVNHEPPLSQYAVLNGGVPKISNELPPIVAIPTTAGSGSEVGRAALVTLNDGRKMGFLSPGFVPDAAVLDADLLDEMPRWLAAGSGTDAISHCIETFCSTRFNPVADALALDGLRRGWWAIGPAVDGDTDAREQMLLCSLCGGLAFQKSLGAVHSLSHPLGGLTERKLHHGTLNGLFLPHVLKFNRDAAADKLDRLASTVGLQDGDALVHAVAGLLKTLGLPTRLRDLGLTWDEVEPLAQAAAGDHCSPTNPRSLSAEDCRGLYRAAM